MGYVVHMKTPKPKKRGRPISADAGIQVGLRFRESTIKAAKKIAKVKDFSMNEAIRYAVEKTADEL